MENGGEGGGRRWGFGPNAAPTSVATMSIRGTLNRMLSASTRAGAAPWCPSATATPPPSPASAPPPSPKTPSSPPSAPPSSTPTPPPSASSLPEGSAMGMKNWLRVTFAIDPSSLEDGLDRLKSFSQRQAKKSN